MINISARGFELKQGTKDGIESELKRIEKMLPENARFDVTLTKERDDYECDITVRHIGSFIRGEARAERIEPVVDASSKHFLSTKSVKAALMKLPMLSTKSATM